MTNRQKGLIMDRIYDLGDKGATMVYDRSKAYVEKISQQAEKSASDKRDLKTFSNFVKVFDEMVDLGLVSVRES